MSHLSASFSATIRVGLADDPGSFARVAQAIGDAGGSLGAIDLVRADGGTKVRDVTVEASDADHLERIVAAVRAVEGVEVEHVSDRTFLLHLGGKLEMRSKTPIRTRDDLSMAYTPGVARICMAIAQDRDAAWNLTVKRNSVAVVSDGTAVLGLGDIGPEAAMPVMEGKATPGRSASRRRTSTRSSPRSPRSRRASAASTSRTSPRRAASRSSGACRRSSTSRSSTTTSMGPRSSCSPRC
jgi:malate dehydrogenase (oxaloacetate-decarboxylating)